MAEHTDIEWSDATWQVITGCSVATPGCTNCYAMRLAGTRLQHHPSRAGLTRDTKAGPVWTGEVRFNEQWLTQPLTWRRPRKIFAAAHGDLFHEAVPDDVLDRVFAVMALCPQHTFQVLTKRAGRMRSYMTAPNRKRAIAARVMCISELRAREVGSHKGRIALDHFSRCFAGSGPFPNIWLGVSVEDQRRADERIPDLLATPAAVRWISAEPLLGPVDLKNIQPQDRAELDALRGMDFDQGLPCARLDWVVVGGESGPGARPMHPDWARSLRDQCAAAGVPYLFKQQGAWAEVAEHPRGRFVSSEPDVEAIQSQGPAFMAPIGKKAAGRLLDGIEHNGSPEAAR
ncbi:hypothetical protein NS228_12800 [Methylobacterium indicum]|uniref:DUF5131 family protein n=1 Tax=Methylobacterium indicum TaxID=1775910 RepID=UPI00073415A3|nr:phage Gp37/Gp68 family protein [Methylobacterium indicum]KTS30484.1 hypothetical protein NS229_16300 [Methylobacterium indicum]KTS40022.1 hypothetical protein NS228_12800 [Methylobacterium indicum]KTS53642.1 hypothetical protein NS230_05030 [Methylobacterium indicum]